MKFWNDSLRICRKCKATVELNDEVRRKCPKCNADVWFFNYRVLPPTPPVPPPKSPSLWKNPTTTLLLGVVGILGLVALVSVHQTAVVAAVCSLAAIGFAVFGFIRHAETRRLEDALEHTQEVAQYAEVMRERVRELTMRYNSLLQTGNAVWSSTTRRSTPGQSRSGRRPKSCEPRRCSTARRFARSKNESTPWRND